MGESHVVTGLKSRRISIATEIDELDRQRRQLLVSLRHIDGCLKVMGFTGNPEAMGARRKRRCMFRRGQLTQFVCTAEREQGANINHKDIAAIILGEMSWQDDGELLDIVAKKVKDARKALRRKRQRHEQIGE
jgi:hypothetical protein